MTHDCDLSESDIAEVFAPSFLVKANGRTHPADLRVYREFLNGFRSTICVIDYEVEEIIAERRRAVLPMKAQIARVNGSIDRFEAMLLLEFDSRNLVSLWQEVYIQTS
ncbi:hypothetical protein R3Q06_30590 [Rhodococcus erythropolis]|uniref:hypothetical protein n=1 Tax=Rhodococcus erythropolis TaxID=1833 RepID=UPI0029494FEB|nr:hypothetical protein [Rhodococcus erythropolis]MDV6277843.1 hypothetical protein [Rhodococcus erythropolis]